MSWSYDAGQIAASDLFKIRYLVGDTNPADKLVQDEEIAFALAERGSKYAAASMVCQALAAKFSREADTVDKDLRTTLSQRAAAFRQMASAYEEQASESGGAPILVAGLPSSFSQ